jgi:hypothetical protein
MYFFGGAGARRLGHRRRGGRHVSVQGFAHPLGHSLLALGDDELADHPGIADLRLDPFPTLADEAWKVFDHGQRDAHRSEDEEIERPAYRARLFRLLLGLRVGGILRHSRDRASSSCRPAGSGV